MPDELITLLIAALPVSELRGAIPLGLLSFKLPLVKVLLFAILGNLIPVIPLLLFLKPVTEKLRHFSICRKFFEHLFKRARKKAAVVEKYQALGLILFVAIPLPVTGAWTGCIVASLFKIKFRYAFLSISLGVCIAAAIVTLATVAGEGIWKQLFLSQ